MSLFSLDKILLNESSVQSMDIDTIGYIDNEFNNHSFVQEGYDFIIEMGRDYMNAEKAFLETVLGSYGDNEIITESFSDFFDKIKAIIRKFIDWIKKVFKEFVTKLNSLVSSEKYIKKNRKLLNKFDSNDEFEYKGYKFTRISDSTVPEAIAMDAFTSENGGAEYLNATAGEDTWYASGQDNIDISSTADRATQTSELNTRLDAKLTNLEDSLDGFYDTFRGLVIKKSEKIDANDYAEELFKFFRDNDDTPSDITIDASYVSEAYRRFDTHKETIKSIEKTQKEIIKNYEALEKYLDKMLKLNKASDPSKQNMTISASADSSNSYVDKQVTALGKGFSSAKTVYSSSTYDKMNNYLKVQSSKVNQMCSIHTQAFSAKLEAAKDQFKQDKKIIYKALQQIIKNHSKSE